jgi:phosphatidylserine decarboxylase
LLPIANLEADFRYRLAEFVGGDDWARALASRDSLYQIVLYLAPGDYHGFHAPADVVFSERRHFCGLLLPVAPWMLRAVPSLFEANERVVLLGSYADEKGRSFPLVYAAVGATNVGSVAMKFDPALVTNASKDVLGTSHRHRFAPSPVRLRRGEEVGFFRMGSTVVMVFAADPSFKFGVAPGDAVKLGQKLNV